MRQEDRMRNRVLLAIVTAVVASGVPAILSKAVAAAKPERRKLLYLTQSAGFKHDSIPISRDIVKQIGEKSGLFDTTEVDDVSDFTADTLRNYDVVMFYTTGELPMSETQKKAFTSYLSDGHAFIGVHSATDTFYMWDQYLRIVGGYFDGHPWHQNVTVDVAVPDNNLVKFLGRSFQISDEIYQISDYQWRDSKVLLRLDPNSVDLTKQGVRKRFYNWPLAWTRK